MKNSAHRQNGAPTQVVADKNAMPKSGHSKKQKSAPDQDFNMSNYAHQTAPTEFVEAAAIRFASRKRKPRT
jgi:hypothetical protein